MWYNLALTYNNTDYDIYLNNTKLPETIIYKDLSSSTLNIGAYITDEIQIEQYTTSISIHQHSMVVIDNNMYVFGGSDHTYSILNKFYKISADGILEEITLNGDSTNKPFARSGHSMVVIGSNIYIFGGISWNYDDGRSELYNDLYKIDINSKSEKISFNVENITKRYIHTMVVLDNNFYIYCGKNEDSSGSFVNYNILDDLVKIPSDIKYLNGKIADLRLYNTIKTEDEINTIYNQYSR